MNHSRSLLLGLSMGVSPRASFSTALLTAVGMRTKSLAATVIAPASNKAWRRSSRRSAGSSIPTQRRIKSSGSPRAARVAGSIEACLRRAQQCSSRTDVIHSRHHARHTDQAIHGSKANADSPQASRSDNAFTKFLVARLEGQHSAVACK